MKGESNGLHTNGDVGSRIKILRLDARLTQRQLAEKVKARHPDAHVTAAYISRIEANERTPSPGTFALLGEVLGVSALVLARGRDTATCPYCLRPAA